MPINTLGRQRRVYEVGRIRTGVTAPTSGGRSRPQKLGVFRFTSRDQDAIRAVAEQYGGIPRAWDGAPVDDQWEVVTEAREIGVVVPPGPQAVSQWLEMWSGGGCVRRCDGDRERLRDVPCLCAGAPEGADQCKPTTRVGLVLPDVPGLGVWRLESHGWHAAHELGGTAELLARVREAGQWVPAVLRLEQREQVVAGQTRRFAVPVLSPRATVRELVEGPRTGVALPPAPSRPAAITAAPESPATAPESPAPAGQAAAPAAPAAGSSLRWPPSCPQDVVAHVLAAPSRTALANLARRVRSAGWWDEFVDSRYAPELISLGDVFGYRDAELQSPVSGTP